MIKSKSDHLNRWLTLGANLGVVLGLIILIVEVRQNAALTRAEMESGKNEDLRNHDRAAVAARYDRYDAILILNGDRKICTIEEIEALYRDQWTGPTSFGWRDLSYEVLDSDSLITTGKFDWGTPDGIERYFYSNVLHRQDGEFRIRLEVESRLTGSRGGQP